MVFIFISTCQLCISKTAGFSKTEIRTVNTRHGIRFWLATVISQIHILYIHKWGSACYPFLYFYYYTSIINTSDFKGHLKWVMIIYSTVRFSSSAKITICLILFLSVVLFLSCVRGEARHPSVECPLPGAVAGRPTLSRRCPPFPIVLRPQGQTVWCIAPS